MIFLMEGRFVFRSDRRFIHSLSRDDEGRKMKLTDAKIVRVVSTPAGQGRSKVRFSEEILSLTPLLSVVSLLILSLIVKYALKSD